MRRTSASLAIICIAAYAGNMIAIGISHGHFWLSLPPEVFMQDFQHRFPYIFGATALTLFPALASTLSMVVIRRAERAVQRAWWRALLTLLVVVVISLIYHFPTNLIFLDQGFSDAEAVSRLKIWLGLHWVRVSFALWSAVYAIRAVRL